MNFFVGALISLGIASPALYAMVPLVRPTIADSGFSLAWVPSRENFMSPHLCAVAATPAGIKIQWRARPCGWLGKDSANRVTQSSSRLQSVAGDDQTSP
jgi:hypothetical protein